MPSIARPSSAVVAASAPWRCVGCDVENAPEALVCAICMRARPLDPRGVPQVFKGLVVHFNGIIPRTLRHPSHAVEWRMAERHGAQVVANFDPDVVNALVYRPGYERSDKVRLCVEHHSERIPCLPITWLLECMLQARRLHPAMFRLQFIPSVALPTPKGSVLPHHQHPFFVQNVAEYALFPSQLPENQRAVAAADQAAQLAVSSGGSAGTGTALGPPPQWTVPPLRMAVVPVFEAAAAAEGEARVRRGTAGGAAGGSASLPPASPVLAADDVPRSPLNALFDPAAAAAQNRVLFRGCRFLLSEALGGKTATGAPADALRARGGVVEPLPTDLYTDATAAADASGAFATATHFLYAHADKKSTATIAAAHATAVGGGALVLLEAVWAEDCLMVGELVPPAPPYVPTSKLLATLRKKWEKAGASGQPSPITPVAADR